MSWNYRAIRHKKGEDTWYDVRDVYYDKDGNVILWGALPQYPSGSDTGELERDLQMMLAGLSKPIIDASDLPAGRAEEREVEPTLGLRHPNRREALVAMYTLLKDIVNADPAYMQEEIQAMVDPIFNALYDTGFRGMGEDFPEGA